MSQPLGTQADQFGERLTRLVTQVIDTDMIFIVIGAGDDPARRIRPGMSSDDMSDHEFTRVPLRRADDDPDDPVLFLQAEYKVRMDDEATHLAVLSSSVGLWVRSDDSKGPGSPAVRLEYGRDATSKPSAHVHFHAESSELAWLYGTAGEPLHRFHDLHFPMGGRRFRPTLEDFLLFLDRERLFTNWKTPNWRSIVMESHAEWEARQARSTARRHPQEVAAQLRAMGYQVSEPA